MGPELPILIATYGEILQGCLGGRFIDVKSNEYYHILGVLQQCIPHYENELAVFAKDHVDYSISIRDALREIKRAIKLIKFLKRSHLLEKNKSIYNEIIADFPDFKLELIEEKIRTTAKKEILDIIKKHEISPYDNSDDYREEVDEIINFRST